MGQPNQAVGAQLRQDRAQGVDRYRKTDVLSAEVDCRGDADDLPLQVDQRPTRVTEVDRSVGLDEVLERAIRRDVDASAFGADDANRDRVL